MGMGCTRAEERVSAAVGLLAEAPTRFEVAQDVAGGGVLWALPALVANGLLEHTRELFQLPKGFYSVVHVFLLLGYMALARIRTMEQLRYHPPGEWGKLLGLDRVPEVRTLRQKVKALAEPERVGEWGQQLSQQWMGEEPGEAGTLYVDGHVRVYHGGQTKLPRRYVARQRLCLRGITDYWVNDQRGRPFFVVGSPLNEGLLSVLEGEVAPRLLREVPGQPSEEELAADPYQHRFTMIFDREGYSPEFFQRMGKLRIACQTYHKHPQGDWPAEEFVEQVVKMPHGGPVRMMLAERGIQLGEAGGWLREIRKLTETGHQVSILSTNFQEAATGIAGHMFARWSQENFFQYMRQHFALDRLVDYQTVPVDETAKVVNPAHRQLESEIRSKAGKLQRLLAGFGKLAAPSGLETESMAIYEQQQGEMKEQIDLLQREVEALKARRKETPKRIPAAQLPDSERFELLAPTRKQFIDLVKMIAYRAETALAVVLRDHLARRDDARALLRQIFTAEADLVPDEAAGTLTVRLHHLSSHAADEAARSLAEHLNTTETVYPGTNLRLVYKLVSD
jgi:hypothetical protein